MVSTTSADAYLSVSTPAALALPSLLAAGAPVREAIADRCRSNLDDVAEPGPGTPGRIPRPRRRRLERGPARAVGTQRGRALPATARAAWGCRPPRALLRFSRQGLAGHQPPPTGRPIRKRCPSFARRRRRNLHATPFRFRRWVSSITTAHRTNSNTVPMSRASSSSWSMTNRLL